MSSGKNTLRPLTEKQLALLNFITDFIAAHQGMAPTIRECGHFFGRSDSTIYAHLLALRRKGFLRRSSQARSIVLADSAVAGTLRYIPVFEKLDAGCDFCRQKAKTHLLAVLPETRKPCFAVRMRDDSLHDVGIFEEDLVIAEWCATPETGDLVVTATAAGIQVERFFRQDPYRNVFGVVLSIRRFYR